MPVVHLKSPALLTVSAARNISHEGQRNFSLALLDEDGEIEKFVDLKDSRYPARVRRPNPAYYELSIFIDLKPGDYMLMAGGYGTKERRYYHVDMLGISEIPNPRTNKREVL